MNKTKFNSVIFDVDSTLVKIEGLDFLAGLKHKQEDLQNLTAQAMDGKVAMRQAMKIKMAAIAPSLEDLVAMGKAYIDNLTPGVIETISTLKKNGITVWILTGNFQPAVGILAKHLGIDPSHVIANDIYHDDQGHYLGFNIDNPLSNNYGKAKMVKKHQKRMGKTVFVGDGGTDLETKEVVNLFIGFGGVIKRPTIEASSDVYTSEPNMTAILPIILKR